MITPDEAGRTGGHDEPPDELTKQTAHALYCLIDGSEYTQLIQIVQILEHHFNKRRKKRDELTRVIELL